MTTTIHASAYTKDLPIAFSPLVKEEYGNRYNLTSDGKQLVLIFPGVQAKVCEQANGRPFLVIEDVSSDVEHSQQLMNTLRTLRDRAGELLGFGDGISFHTHGKGLSKRPCIYLNFSSKATIKNLQKQDVEYSTLVGKTCKFGIFLHIQSVFNGDAGLSLRYQISQTVLQEIMQPTCRVAPVEPEMVEDPSELL